MVELDVNDEDGSVGFCIDGAEIVRLSSAGTPADRAKVTTLVAEVAALRARVAASTPDHASLIAHDTNNALAAIVCAAQALVRHGDPAVTDIASQIVEECTHAAELVRDLLPDARARPMRVKRVDVNDAVVRLTPTLTRIVECAADVSTELAPEVGSACIGLIDLERVLVNLVTNARDASARKIVVTTAAIDGRWVLVTVKDDGIGMDPTTARAASNAFFPTKPPFASGGLGLASVHRIARSAGGHLRFDTAPGAGTRVELWLPSA